MSPLDIAVTNGQTTRVDVVAFARNLRAHVRTVPPQDGVYHSWTTAAQNTDPAAKVLGSISGNCIAYDLRA